MGHSVMNEQYAMPTLRQVLTQQKLPVPCRTSAAASRNTIGWTWPDLEVAVWDEFTLPNLNESYGHILALEAQRPFPRADQLLQRLATNSAADVKELIGWNDGLLRPALERAKSHLGLYSGTVLHHVHSTADKSVIAKLRNVRQRLTVDHIIGLDDFPIQNPVVGLGRPSRKWSGGTLANQIQSGSVTGSCSGPSGSWPTSATRRAPGTGTSRRTRSWWCSATAREAQGGRRPSCRSRGPDTAPRS